MYKASVAVARTATSDPLGEQGQLHLAGLQAVHSDRCAGAHLASFREFGYDLVHAVEPSVDVAACSENARDPVRLCFRIRTAFRYDGGES